MTDTSVHGTHRSEYRPDIDGLRALAVGVVVAFHANAPLFRGGFVGVDVFFVISGYLISGIVMRESQAGTFRIAAFYARRARRILPALSLVLAAVLLAGWLESPPRAYATLGGNVAAGAAFVSNIWLWNTTAYFGAAGGENPLLHLWSLGVEEQYYVLWPLILTFLAVRRRPDLAVVLLLAASFLVSVQLSVTQPTAAFYSPVSRAWELLVGSVLAVTAATRGDAMRIIAGAFARSSGDSTARVERTVRHVASALGVLLIVAALATTRRGVPFPGVHALFPTAGAALVIAAGADAWVNRVVLSTRGAVFFGLISYPLYLWHWPVLVFARLRLGLAPEVAVVAVAIAIVAAYLTYRLVEIPIRRVSGFRFVGSLLVAQAVALIVGVTLASTNGLPGRFDSVRQRLFAYAADPRMIGDTAGIQCLLAPDALPADLPPGCGVAAHAGEPGRLLLLWGDSYADHLAPGIRRLELTGVHTAQLTSSLCPPIFGYLEARRPQCAAVNAFVRQWIAERRPQMIVLAARWNEYRYAELEATLVVLREMGARDVMLVGSTIQFGEPVPFLLARSGRRGPIPDRLPSPLEGALRSVDGALASIAARAGARFVPLLDVECPRGECLVAVGGSADSVMVWDDGHLTELGSVLIVRNALGSALRAGPP